MAIYLSEDLVKLLKGQKVLFLGDSVQRSIYKDFVALCQGNRFLSQNELKTKGEATFLGDNLIERSELTNGVGYREVRKYHDKPADLHLKFYFLTRVYNDYVESILQQLEDGTEYIPNIVILNSCLWDISRYGRDSMALYRRNLHKFCKRLNAVLPPETLVIWRTTLPVSHHIKGGFMTAETEWCRDSIRLDVLRANYYAYNIVHQYGYNVIDLHYHFRHQIHRQARDGVHWNMYAHRRVTNIILESIALAWNFAIPKIPWHDDSKVSFNTSDIVMNRTNVLHEAYLVQGMKSPVLPKYTPGSCLANVNEVAPNIYEDDSTRLFYTDMYSIPCDDYGTNVDSMEIWDGYQIMVPSLSRHARVTLPAEPYPNGFGCSQKYGGPVRYSRRDKAKGFYSRPGKASEMLRMRVQKERKKEEKQMLMEGGAHLNCYDQYVSGNEHCDNRWLFESRPVYYSAHTHRY